MTRVTSATYVRGVLYTPDGPDVPQDVLGLIGDHLIAEEDRQPVDDGQDTGTDGGGEQKPDGDVTGAGGRPDGRHGFDRWLTYAGEQGVDVPEDVIDGKDKDALIALVEQHEAAATQTGPGADDGPAA